MITPIIILVITLIYAWALVNFLSWRDIRKFDKKMYPFSFRILLGADQYLKWAKERWNRIIST